MDRLKKFFGRDYVEHIHLLKVIGKQTFNIFISLEKILSAMTWEERGFIYNF